MCFFSQCIAYLGRNWDESSLPSMLLLLYYYVTPLFLKWIDTNKNVAYVSLKLHENIPAFSLFHGQNDRHWTAWFLSLHFYEPFKSYSVQIIFCHERNQGRYSFDIFDFKKSNGNHHTFVLCRKAKDNAKGQCPLKSFWYQMCVPDKKFNWGQ